MDQDNQEHLLDLCIDTCANFERQTGVKTSELKGKSQRALSEALNLSLADVKRWQKSSQAAQDIVENLERERAAKK